MDDPQTQIRHDLQIASPGGQAGDVRDAAFEARGRGREPPCQCVRQPIRNRRNRVQPFAAVERSDVPFRR